jgi:nucleoside-diphosphate-sugar epimerase
MPDPLASLAIQKDLRAVVTAGAGGIGRAIADALIANRARVLVSDVGLYLSLEFRNIKNSR